MFKLASVVLTTVLVCASIIVDQASSVANPVHTAFNPAVNGFQFVNDFQNDVVKEVDIRTGGLCGGMSYAALDYFLTHTPIPTQNYRPAVQTPLHDYIYNRQTTSLTSNLDKWAEIGFNPFGARDSEFFNWGLQDRIPELRSFLDRGVPVPLGLQAYGHGNTEGNHQILAVGYDMGQYAGHLGPHEEDFKIFVYDPNYPGQSRTLIPDLGQKGYRYLEGGNELWRTYFVDRKYQVQTPPVVASLPNGAFGLANQLLIAIRTGNDDLRGGNDNANMVIRYQNRSTQQVPNINGGRRWIDNYTETISIPLTQPVSVSELNGLAISITSDGGLSGDNWNVDSLTVIALGNGVNQQIYSGQGSPLARLTGDRHSFSVLFNQSPAGSNATQHTLFDANGGPIIRFTGDTHDFEQSLTVAPEDTQKPVSTLTFLIRTGGDDLRGGNDQEHDNADLSVTVRSGNRSKQVLMRNINQDTNWPNNSDHTVQFDLPPGTHAGDLLNFRLHTNFGGGFGGDNWNVDHITVQATY